MNVNAKSREISLGLVYKHDGYNCFYLRPTETGNKSVSTINPDEIKCTLDHVKNSLSLNLLLKLLNVNIIEVPDNSVDYIDLSLENLQKDTLLNLFNA